MSGEKVTIRTRFFFFNFKFHLREAFSKLAVLCGFDLHSMSRAGMFHFTQCSVFIFLSFSPPPTSNIILI